jgi:SAM-dependent methyltransferase
MATLPRPDCLMMINEPIRSVLRSPTDLQPLTESSDGRAFMTADGRVYPMQANGILCLLDEAERGLDMGDDHFYDKHPFGSRDWKDTADLSRGVESELKDLLQTISKDALIADVGCGTGRISNYLSYVKFKNVASIDLSPVSLSFVRRNSENACLLGNNLHLPIKPDAFDLVISSGVIHHTPSPTQCLQELARIMKPGGVLYLNTYNINSLYGYLFYSYGSVLRALNASPTKWLADLLGFQVYRMIRSVLPLPRRSVAELRAKYENLFLKPMVHFFTTKQIRGEILSNNLEVISEKKRGGTHRMHNYVARKKT